VDPRGRSEHGRSCSGAFGGDKMSAQGWSSFQCLGSGSSRDRECSQDWRLADRRRRVLAMVLQDGGDGVVGARAEHQRAGAGGVDACGAEAFYQAEDADAGAEPLLGVRPERRITSARMAVLSPIELASRRMRSCVQSR
jgi:hypothetical protein